MQGEGYEEILKEVTFEQRPEFEQRQIGEYLEKYNMKQKEQKIWRPKVRSHAWRSNKDTVTGAEWASGGEQCGQMRSEGLIAYFKAIYFYSE